MAGFSFWRLSERGAPISHVVTEAIAFLELVHWTGPWLWDKIYGNAPSLSPNAALWADAIQAGVILLLVLFPPTNPRIRKEKEFEPAVSATDRFIVCWNSLWAVFFVWYALRALARYHDVFQSEEVQLGLDFVGEIENTLLFLCFAIMTVPTRRSLYRLGLAIICFWLAFTALEAYTVLVANRPDLGMLLDGAQGLIAGLILALFVGRLESKFIGTKRWIVAALYAYAILQLAYPLYQNPGTQQFPYLTLASLFLVLKVIFFWEIRRIIVSGTMTYYLHKAQQIDDTVEEDRKAFLQSHQDYRIR